MQQQQRLPHALLISGRAGLGKTVFAERLVASLLCAQPDEQFMACGHCHSCQLLDAQSHPDHTRVAPEDTGKQIKVDQIRSLKQSQTLMPKVSAAKTVLITTADQMNISAFNSLLKLLEEPQPDSTLILLSQNPQQLPITIKSRCQNVVIPVPDNTQALAWLAEQDPQIDNNQWQALLKVTQGAPLTALSLGDAGLAQSRQINADIALLMRGQGNPVKMAADWQQYDLKSVLLQIQSMMQTKISQLLVTADNKTPPVLRPYWAIVDCITATLKLISSQNNLNKILLIEDFMVTVMQHAEQIHKLQGTHR
jgi:DNA polymerase-3 subunit delta'